MSESDAPLPGVGHLNLSRHEQPGVNAEWLHAHSQLERQFIPRAVLGNVDNSKARQLRGFRSTLLLWRCMGGVVYGCVCYGAVFRGPPH